MAYPTRATLVGESSSSELLALGAPEQDALYAASVSAVEAYTGQSFDTAVAATKVLDSRNKRRVYLPRRLSSLTTLVVTRSAITAADVVLADDHSHLDLLPTATVQNYYTRALVSVDPDFESEIDDTGWRRPLFTLGYSTINITGVWGWTDAEYDAQLGPVSLALRYDMEDQARLNSIIGSASLEQYRILGVQRVRQQQLEVDFQRQVANAPSLGGSMGLSQRVMRLLTPFIWTPDLGEAV